MILILQFEFPDTVIDLTVDVIDHPGPRSWVKNFRGFSVDGWYQNRNVQFLWQPDHVEQHLNDIRQHISALNQQGFEFPLYVPTVDQLDQKWCNTTHRLFTHGERRVQTENGWNREVSLHLDAINHNIHQLEMYLGSPVAKRFPHGIWEFEMTINDVPPASGHLWWYIDPAWSDNHTQQHHDVILGSQILGKTVLRSYLDQDNPCDWDTAGHSISFGGLVLQIDRLRERIYRSSEFRNWANQHGAIPEQLRCDWPIGNIRDRDKMIEQLMKQYIQYAQQDGNPFIRVNYL